MGDYGGRYGKAGASPSPRPALLTEQWHADHMAESLRVELQLWTPVSV